MQQTGTRSYDVEEALNGVQILIAPTRRDVFSFRIHFQRKENFFMASVVQ